MIGLNAPAVKPRRQSSQASAFSAPSCISRSVTTGSVVQDTASSKTHATARSGAIQDLDALGSKRNSDVPACVNALVPANRFVGQLDMPAAAVPAAQMAAGTIFDPRLRATLTDEEQEKRGEDAHAAVKALSPKLFGIIYACLTANTAEGLAQVFSYFDPEAVAKYLVDGTFSKSKPWSVLKKLQDPPCVKKDAGTVGGRGKSLWQDLKQRYYKRGIGDGMVAGIAEFVKMIPSSPTEKEINNFLDNHNAKVADVDRLNLAMLHHVFSAYNFVSLQERAYRTGKNPGELAVLFQTTVENSTTRFYPMRFSNGRLVNENQAAIAANQAFLDLSIRKVSSREWHVLAGLMQEQLLFLGNANSLDIPEEQKLSAEDFLKKIFQEIQAVSVKNPDGDPLKCINEALDRVVSGAYMDIWHQMQIAYDVNSEPQPDPTVPQDRYFSQQADLAKQAREKIHLKAVVESHQFLWATLGQWMPQFVESGGAAVSGSSRKIREHDETQKVRLAFDAFIDQFTDPERAALEGRSACTVPVDYWSANIQAYDRYIYSFSALSWQFMKYACGAGKSDAAVREIWADIEKSADISGSGARGFPRMMFELSLEELRKDASFGNGKKFFDNVAMLVLSLNDGRLTWEQFQQRMLPLMETFDSRIGFKAVFDTEHHEQQENEQLAEFGYPGVLKNRDDFIESLLPSVFDPSQSGNSADEVGGSATSILATIHKQMQAELQRMVGQEGLTQLTPGQTQEIGSEIQAVLRRAYQKSTGKAG